MKNLWFILYFPLALLILWGAIWVSNAAIYLTSYSISFLGIVEGGGVFERYPFLGFIYYAFSAGIFYFWTLNRVFHMISGAFLYAGNKWLGRVLFLLLGFVVIAIYDPAVAGVMPSSLQSLITFANEELYAYLLGGADLVTDDFSGRSVARMHYLVFDVCIAGFFLVAFYYDTFTNNKEKEDLNTTA